MDAHIDTHACMRACMRTYVTYIHAYMCTYMHTHYIYTCAYTKYTRQLQFNVMRSSFMNPSKSMLRCPRRCLCLARDT